MLTKCPECELQVSTKALTCPHCGYPFKETKISRKRTKKRMRLPNGFGSITERKDQPLRKPFYVRVCVGKTETGRPILKGLKPNSFFETYNEAYQALVEYHKDPYSIEDDITMDELYKRWSAEYFEKISTASSRSIISAWNYSIDLHKLTVKSVRARHLKAAIDNGHANIKGEERKASADTKKRMKSLYNMLFDYAVEYELTDKNYARLFNVSDDVIDEARENIKEHIAFTKEELSILWKFSTEKICQIVLIQCYTGLRPQELCMVKRENVNINEWYMIAGMKTKAGTDRTIPIHHRIRSFILNFYRDEKEYLINLDGPLTYYKYNYRFGKMIGELELNENHRTHDPRKTFVTMAKNANMNEFAIKRIVGHSIRTDLTESVYTERSVEWLLSEIEKI